MSLLPLPIALLKEVVLGGVTSTRPQRGSSANHYLQTTHKHRQSGTPRLFHLSIWTRDVYLVWTQWTRWTLGYKFYLPDVV
ncbi:MAG: hypothetical protein Q9171_004261 [Xanthocarpia ochracea]